MPSKPLRPCNHPHCQKLAASTYCPDHQPERPKDDRPSLYSPQRYGREWPKIRRIVLLQHGIPEAEHHLWNVDHTPRYDKAIEPDHWKYQLTPMLKSDHSRKTARIDGGFGNKREGGIQPSGAPKVTRVVQVHVCDGKKNIKG